MIKNAKNKQITDAASKEEGTPQEYFFHGNGEYEPITIIANSREEAERLWQERRVKVEPPQKINE
jgi:hypothetical protein